MKDALGLLAAFALLALVVYLLWKWCAPQKDGKLPDDWQPPKGKD